MLVTIMAAHLCMNGEAWTRLCCWTDRAKRKLETINLHVLGVVFPSTMRITARNNNLKQTLSVACLKLKYEGL